MVEAELGKAVARGGAVEDAATDVGWEEEVVKEELEETVETAVEVGAVSATEDLVDEGVGSEVKVAEEEMEDEEEVGVVVSEMAAGEAVG